jgi:coenzyme F420-reducing hydrogenase delta subunit
MPHAHEGQAGPRILVFSTNNISDPGIDLAGSAHMHYSPRVVTISVPCSSGIRPQWVLHAIEAGFDGVFIAADGTDCAYMPDCTDRTGRVVAQAQTLLRERDIDPRRLKMAAICSVCAESFVSHMEKLGRDLTKLAAEQPERKGAVS